MSVFQFRRLSELNRYGSKVEDKHPDSPLPNQDQRRPIILLFITVSCGTLHFVSPPLLCPLPCCLVLLFLLCVLRLKSPSAEQQICQSALRSVAFNSPLPEKPDSLQVPALGPGRPSICTLERGDNCRHLLVSFHLSPLGASSSPPLPLGRPRDRGGGQALTETNTGPLLGRHGGV